MPSGTPKYEREIAEILARLDRDEARTPASRMPPPRSAARPPRQIPRAGRELGFGRFGDFASTWRWLGLTIALGISGAIVQRYVPLLGAVFGLLMVLVFLSPVAGAATGGPRAKSSHVWRGQVIDLPPRGGLASRISYHWRRLRRRRH